MDYRLLLGKCFIPLEWLVAIGWLHACGLGKKKHTCSIEVLIWECLECSVPITLPSRINGKSTMHSLPCWICMAICTRWICIACSVPISVLVLAFAKVLI